MDRDSELTVDISEMDNQIEVFNNCNNESVQVTPKV